MFDIFITPFALWHYLTPFLGVAGLISILVVFLKISLLNKLKKSFSEKEAESILNNEVEDAETKIESVGGSSLKMIIDLLMGIVALMCIGMLILAFLNLIIS